jgi:hypothetical protein
MQDHDEYWHAGITVDPALSWIVSQHKGRPTDALIREAFFLTERRIRAASGLQPHIFGVELIDRVFGPSDGILQPVSELGAERAGFHEMFRGAFLLYQTAVHRGGVYLGENEVRQIMHLVNHLLHLVDSAVTKNVDINRYLGSHEGRVRHRRDFRLDIDADDELEIVSLIDVGPTMKRSNSLEGAKLVTVILDRDSSNQLRRIPAETINSETMDPAANCQLFSVTGGARPDIYLSWGAGETGGQHYLMRWDKNSYVLVKRAAVAPRGSEPWDSYAFVSHHLYQQVQILDVDGDGHDEVIERDADWSGQTALQQAGFERELPSRGEVATIARVWKWNEQSLQLEQVDLVALA